MATRLSRRKLANYAAERLIAGDEAVIDELASHLLVEKRQREAELLARDIEDELARRGVVVATVESAAKLDSSAREIIKKLILDQSKLEKRTVVSVDGQSATRVSPAAYARETRREACPATDATVSNHTKAKPAVYLKETINPDLIGGVRIVTPTQMLDATIAKKLHDLKSKRM